MGFGLQVLSILSASVLVAAKIKSKPCEQGELFPHENNYNSFYMCNKGKRVPVSCPYGLYFNQNAEGCDYLSEDFLLKVKPLQKHEPPVRTSIVSYEYSTPLITSTSQYAMNSGYKFKLKNKAVTFRSKSKLKKITNPTPQPYQDLRPETGLQSYAKRRQNSLIDLYGDINSILPSKERKNPKLNTKTKLTAKQLKTTPVMYSEMYQYVDLQPEPVLAAMEMYPDVIISALTTQRSNTNSELQKQKIRPRLKKKRKQQRESAKKRPKLKVTKKQKFVSKMKTVPSKKTGLELKIYPDYEMYLNVDITKKPKTVARTKPELYMNIKQKSKAAMQRKLMTPEKELQQYLDVYPEFSDNMMNKTHKRTSKMKLRIRPNITPYMLRISVPTVEPFFDYNSITDNILRIFTDANSTQDDHKQRELYTDSNVLEMEKESAFMESDLENFPDQSFEADTR